MGYNCTVNSFINSFLLKLNDKNIESWGNAIFKYPNDVFPPYVNDLKSSAIITESSETDNTRINLSDFIIQNYDAVLCGQNFDGNLNFLYLEGYFKTLFWIKTGRLLTMNPSPYNRKALSGYEFGTVDGYIYVKNYKYCRCWDNSEQTRNLNIVNYDIDTNNKLPIYYYDKWDGDEKENVFNMIKVPTKRFLGNHQIIIGAFKTTNEGNDTINSDLSLGNNYSNCISIKEFFTRQELNKQKGNYISYSDLSVFTKPIIGRIQTIEAFGLSNSSSAFRFNSPLPIKNCELTFDCSFLGNASDHFFDVYDKNKIVVNKLIYTEKKMIKLCGTNKIDLLFIVNNDYDGDIIKENFIVNPEFEYPYFIKLIANSFVRIFTNITRPILTEIDKGYQYFDITLNKPIWWDGTKWIDSIGTTV